MKTNYILKIENPCNENWDSMSENDIGKHCTSCNKDVVDFSLLSDDDIVKYLSKHSSTKTCGRLKPHQLNRVLKVESETRPRYGRIVAALLLIGTAKTTIAQHQNEFPQQQTANSESKSDHSKSITPVQKSLQDSLPKTIKGIVIAQEDKLPIAGVPVSIKGADFGVLTNADGKFKLTIPKDLYDKNFELEFKYIGFKTLVVKIKPTDLKYQQEFKMCTDTEIMGEVVVASKKKWWKFWKKN